MTNLRVDLDYSGIQNKELLDYQKEVKAVHQELYSNPNSEFDFKGWLDLPINYDKKEFERIKKVAKKI